MTDIALKNAVIPAPAGEDGLNRYLAEIRKFPILSPEDEYMLAKRFKEHGDPEAAAKLVTSHLRLVAKAAMRYRGYGLPVADLISEGNVGLIQGPGDLTLIAVFVLRLMRCGGSRPRSRNSSCAAGAWSSSARRPRKSACSSIFAGSRTPPGL